MDVYNKTVLVFLILALTFVENTTAELPKCNVTTSNELVPYCSFSSWFPWDCGTCGVNYQDNQAMAVRKRALCCSKSDQGIEACLSECQQPLGSNEGYGKCGNVCPFITTTTTTIKATALTQSENNMNMTDTPVHFTNRTSADSTSGAPTDRMITTEISGLLMSGIHIVETSVNLTTGVNMTETYYPSTSSTYVANTSTDPTYEMNVTATSEHTINQTTVTQTSPTAKVTPDLTDTLAWLTTGFHGATKQRNNDATCSFGSITMKKGTYEQISYCKLTTIVVSRFSDIGTALAVAVVFIQGQEVKQYQGRTHCGEKLTSKGQQ